MKKSTNNASGSNSMLTLISVLLIAVFVIAGAVMIIPRVQKHNDDKAMRESTKESTVAFLASEANMSAEDFLAQYGLTLGEEINENTLESEMLQNMTIANYNSYVGDSYAIDLSQFSDAVTEDTVYKDFMAMPAKTVLGDEMFDGTKEAYNMGDDVADDISWQDFNTAVQEAYIRMASESAETTETTDSTETAETTETTEAAEAPAAE